MEGKEAAYADLKIAISEDIAKKCRKDGYIPKIITPGIDLDRFNIRVDGSEIRKKYAKEKDKLVLTVARLDPRKDSLTLIEAACNVCRINPRIQFIIAGEGSEKEKIEKRIEELKLTENVFLIGFVPEETLPQYYRASDVFALPTLYEGFGIVYLEAMASGVPIVSTTVPAVPEVVGDAGILVPPKRPDLLAEGILKILENKQLADDFIEKGLEKAQKFDWNSIIDKLEEEYSAMVEKREAS